MKSRKPSFTYTPFEDIKALLRSKSFPLPDRDPFGSLPPKSEETLFLEAMEGVEPISRDNCVERTAQEMVTGAAEGLKNNEDAETLLKLANLVRYGEGFHVSETPEYIEGIGYNVHPGIAKRLHQGDFSIQAHVDLHGLKADEAKEVFDRFLKCAVTTCKTGVLIVHGRGLSSPAEPVLKKKIVEWLTRGPWRKWIIAYSSARSCDGGAGATYVLLRQRPVSKRLRTGRVKGGRNISPSDLTRT